LTTADDSGLGALRRSFGNQPVSDGARRVLVRDLFDRIAPRYDVMNDLMSLGLHRLWKRRAAAIAADAAAAVAGPVVDLAGGTGDISRRMSARLPGRLVVNIDASPGMIAVAARRCGSEISLTVAEAERLPLRDDTVAALALGFGLRNMTDPQLALSEAHRVLKPGGSLVLLEFSKPVLWFAPLYNLYSRYVIPLLGTLVAGDRRAYRYLVESIRLFPDAESVVRELHKCGFEPVRVRRLMWGVAALHVAVKS
jgi:demethylmenaquinone methyltransferase / 2-methoxy-6-polyprenyl-1,4-benzoquinol methylase